MSQQKHLTVIYQLIYLTINLLRLTHELLLSHDRIYPDTKPCPYLKHSQLKCWSIKLLIFIYFLFEFRNFILWKCRYSAEFTVDSFLYLDMARWRIDRVPARHWAWKLPAGERRACALHPPTPLQQRFHQLLRNCHVDGGRRPITDERMIGSAKRFLVPIFDNTFLKF